jgi:hypothetical protein
VGPGGTQVPLEQLVAVGEGGGGGPGGAAGGADLEVVAAALADQAQDLDLPWGEA